MSIKQVNALIEEIVEEVRKLKLDHLDDEKLNKAYARNRESGIQTVNKLQTGSSDEDNLRIHMKALYQELADYKLRDEINKRDSLKYKK